GIERESKQFSHGHATVFVGRAEVLDLLSQLVNKSLVVKEPSAGEKTRHRMLDNIREYAQARLRDSDEHNWVRTRHLDFFIRLVESAEPELTGPDQDR
ncbi:MAG TPA: hypothetical protein VE136_15440, partial [Anaerolineales bacterium]|nr:hypothetical protein [Anaerolineales bacterium]